MALSFESNVERLLGNRGFTEMTKSIQMVYFQMSFESNRKEFQEYENNRSSIGQRKGGIYKWFLTNFIFVAFRGSLVAFWRLFCSKAEPFPTNLRIFFFLILFFCSKLESFSTKTNNFLSPTWKLAILIFRVSQPSSLPASRWMGSRHYSAFNLRNTM